MIRFELAIELNMAKLSLNEFKKAIDSLLESQNLLNQTKEGTPEYKAFRDACIQRFEFCVELSWKISMRLLGSQVAAAKPAIREMGRNNLIDEVSPWMDFIDARNETSHSYDEAIAKKVYDRVPNFIKSVQLLHSKLKDLKS